MRAVRFTSESGSSGLVVRNRKWFRDRECLTTRPMVLAAPPSITHAEHGDGLACAVHTLSREQPQTSVIGGELRVIAGRAAGNRRHPWQPGRVAQNESHEGVRGSVFRTPQHQLADTVEPMPKSWGLADGSGSSGNPGPSRCPSLARPCRPPSSLPDTPSGAVGKPPQTPTRFPHSWLRPALCSPPPSNPLARQGAWSHCSRRPARSPLLTRLMVAEGVSGTNPSGGVGGWRHW